MISTLGQRIQQLRRGLGLSQEQLGEMLGVSRQAVSKWEMDQSEPDLKTVVQLCRTFSVSSDELLGLESRDRQGEDPGVERFVAANLARRLFTAGWVTALVGAVLLVIELICLFPIRNAVIENAIARGSGYYPDLWHYAASFPMSVVFVITAVVVLAGIGITVLGLVRKK